MGQSVNNKNGRNEGRPLLISFLLNTELTNLGKNCSRFMQIRLFTP